MSTTEFKEAVRKALCACLGISASSTEAAILIREAYAEPEPAPRPPRNVDVIYYSFLTEEEPDIPAYSAENPEAGTHRPAVTGFLPVKMVVVCYGPHATEYAHRIRRFLYLDGNGFPRSILRKAGIYPVPDPPQVLILREEEGSLWRERADLTVSMRVKDCLVYSSTRPAITVPPAIEIYR